MFGLTELLLSGVTLIFVIYSLKLHTKTRQNLPPGPWGFPIVGHFPFFGNNPARKFMEWTQHYGPIFSVRFGSVPTIIINDVKLIRKAFSMDEFSGRPRLSVLLEMTGGKGIGFVDGLEQVEQRKFAIKTLKEHSFNTNSVEFRAREEIPKLINNLKRTIRQKPGQPMEMNKMFQYCITNVLWDALMGTRFDESDMTLSNLMKMIEKGTDTNSSIVSQLFWFFPWVCRLGSFIGYNPPVKSFKTIYDFMREKIEEVKPLHVQGQLKTFTDAYFDKVAETTDRNSSFHESKQQQPMSTTDIFMGASDTTPVTMDWLMIYMAQEPHIQTKLQEEIDSVTGVSDSLLSDRPKMPYTEAVIHEILRISSIAPFGIFHRTVQDVAFEGFHIPKDTMVIGNLFGVHHDPEIWDEPERFNPQRFLDENGKLNKLMSQVMAFGIGKRQCPGESFARDKLFLLTTSFFQRFSVSCTERRPSLDYNFGIVLSPHKFKLNVMER